jgi:hypothetical protein
MRWVERYQKDGNVNIHYRKPIAYKVKKEYVDFLLQELKNNKTITLQELLQKLKDKYKGIDCVLMPVPIEISAKILYLSEPVDFGMNALKCLQVNPRKIQELESTYSKLYKMCKKRSEIISRNSRYDYVLKRKSTQNEFYIFRPYGGYDEDGTGSFTRCYTFMFGYPRGVLYGYPMRTEVTRHTILKIFHRLH